ncbi:hypothetical protein VARIO8X_160068 [Burkholderiales bacterium 8X]|nr:hypothetical protein VARIO8X_160068 [Burkholderiales bacterium 8X]
MDPDSKKNAGRTRGSKAVTQPPHTEISEGLAQRELPPEGYEHAKFPVESDRTSDGYESIAGEQPPADAVEVRKSKEPKPADPKAAAEAEEAKRFAAYEAKQKRKDAESGDKTADAKPKALIASSGTVTSGVQHPPSAAVPLAAGAPAKAAVVFAPEPEPEVDPEAAKRERAARLAAVDRLAREDEEKDRPERDRQRIAEDRLIASIEARDRQQPDRSGWIREEDGSRTRSFEPSASNGLELPAGLLSATGDAHEQATLKEAWANVVALDKGYAKDLSRNRNAMSDFAQQVLSDLRAGSRRVQEAASPDDSDPGGFESFKQAALAARRTQFECESPEQAHKVFTDPVLMDDWEIAQIDEIEMAYALEMSRLGS